METDENNDILRSTCNITSLNVWCLINIFQYLSVKELINVSQVHHVFLEIISQHVIGQRLFDCTKISDCYSIELMLQTFGASIRELKLGIYNLGPTILRKRMSGNDILFEFIARYCKSLRMLSLSFTAKELINPDILQRAGRILNHLESLEIEDYDSYKNVRANANSVLQLCPNLQEVKIEFGNERLESLAQFTQLTSFKASLYYPKSYQWKEVLEKNPQIRKLSVYQMQAIDMPILLVLSHLQCLQLNAFNLNHSNFVDTLVVLAQKNTLVDLEICFDGYSLSNNYRSDVRKRQDVKRAMTAFTNLKKICFGPVKENNAIIRDVVTSLPNVVECTFVGDLIQSTILSAVTEKLKVLRIVGDFELIVFDPNFYLKLLKLKKSRKNNHLRIFVEKGSFDHYMWNIGGEYKPEQLKIIPFNY